MNMAQMGLKYDTDKLGRVKMVKLTQQEQEAAMKNHKRYNAKLAWLSKQAALERAADVKKAA